MSRTAAFMLLGIRVAALLTRHAQHLLFRPLSGHVARGTRQPPSGHHRVLGADRLLHELGLGAAGARPVSRWGARSGVTMPLMVAHTRGLHTSLGTQGYQNFIGMRTCKPSGRKSEISRWRSESGDSGVVVLEAIGPVRPNSATGLGVLVRTGAWSQGPLQIDPLLQRKQE